MTTTYFSRRTFIVGSVALAAMPAFSKSQEDKKLMIFMTKKRNEFFLNFYNLDSKKHSTIEIPFSVHSILHFNENYLLLVEKLGQGCCIVNIKKGKIEQIINSSKKGFFYGHGCVDKKNTLFLPQRIEDQYIVQKRNLSDINTIQEEVFSTDKEIHQIELINDRELAICIDDQKDPSVVIINLESKEKTSISTKNPYFRPAHIGMLNKKGSLYLTGRANPKNNDGASWVLLENKNLTHYNRELLLNYVQLFCIAHNEKLKLSCGVSTDSNRFFILDERTKSIIYQDQVDQPFAVSSHEDKFVIISPDGIYTVDPLKRKILSKVTYPSMNHFLDDHHPILI